MIRYRASIRRLCITVLLCCVSRSSHAQVNESAHVEIHLKQQIPVRGSHERKMRMPPAVVWLKPLGHNRLPLSPHGGYTLLQKNRKFTPHLLIVPVGSVVSFPNADPFFHNVFSLFDGKRFDLGLYEAGSTKEVTFSHEGLSYIFCNIHPEMSAVVIALSTPIYAIIDSNGDFQLHDVPVGDYELHVWIEGEMQPVLNKLARHVHLVPGNNRLENIVLTSAPQKPGEHNNKFGQAYGPDPGPVY